MRVRKSHLLIFKKYLDEKEKEEERTKKTNPKGIKGGDDAIHNKEEEKPSQIN